MPNTLRGWCKQRDIDEGRKPGLMTVDTARIKELERANRGLYDTSPMTIPTDRVDAEQLTHPSHWDIAFIRRFMIRFGPISSVFDFATFAVMLWVFDAPPSSAPAGSSSPSPPRPSSCSSSAPDESRSSGADHPGRCSPPSSPS